VLFGAALSRDFDRSSRLVSSCAVWYGYTNGYRSDTELEWAPSMCRPRAAHG
jgi:hypothetical protein